MYANSPTNKVVPTFQLWEHRNQLCSYILQDAFPLGEIVLGTETEGFSVDESAPFDLGVGENGFVLNTPNRIYPLQAATAEDKLEWIATFRAAIEKASSSSNGVTSFLDTYDTEQ